MGNENEFLLHALIMGVFITFLYDLLRILRRVIPHGAFLVSLEDMVFWIYCGAEVFLMMYHESDGTLRWFAVIGALAGMLLYKKLFSPTFVKYTSLVLNKLFGVVGKVLKWLCRPLGFLGRKTGKTIHRARGRLHRLGRNAARVIKNKLTFFLKMLKITLKA